ncbi:MAG: fused MFS/spermidine synthase, partial [Flavipsychrobacter sp.]
MKNTATTSNSTAKSLAQNKLLIISFVEGSCVMVAELAGGKMLAPFYGTSLYVWASTLALTLGGLTIGYYLGGELSKRDLEKRQKALFTILAIASTLVMIMPMLADFIMKRTMDMSFLTGVITSQFIFLLPPIMGMGMVSPLLISMIAEHNASGKAAGLVYAVSTLGGVISTLLTGFWLVPVVGISLPCIVIGALLLI